MVEGIEKFKEYFRDYNGNYIVIGGTACDIITEEEGFVPRATDDIDIVLIIEALHPAFVSKFWEFIKDGGYKIQQKDNDKRCCFRFKERQNVEFPRQIELFSRTPDFFSEEQLKHLTPIPVEEGLSYLSAILLNDEYYSYTVEHSEFSNDIHFAKIEAMICLKAFAFLSNRQRKEEGQEARERDILKHKYDVFRMIFLLGPDARFELPPSILTDLQRFADLVKDDLPPRNIFKVNRFEEEDMSRIFQQLLRNFGLSVQ